LTERLAFSISGCKFDYRNEKADMRIGKTTSPFSAIARADADRIVIRGHDLCAEMIGKVDFTTYFWFLVTGVLPDERQRQLADAVLVALAEHGLVPSVAAARMTLAAAPESMQGAVAAGLLGCGSVVLGSAEVAGRFLAECVAEARTTGAPDAARDGVSRLRTSGRAIPGFGHPQHSEGDPRARTLLALAKTLGTEGEHISMLHHIEAAIPVAIGRTLPINVNGAIPAIMLDAGFPLHALKGIALLSRTAGLIGHLTEEASRPIGFIMAQAADEAITYDGDYPTRD
jgi:citrate synthase